MKTACRSVSARELGQDTIEYALVIAVVALASVVALSALAGQLTAVWNVAAAWFNRPLP